MMMQAIKTSERGKWLWHCRDLRRCIEEKDLTTFLSWPVIRKTMFVGDSLIVKDELEALRNSPNGWDRWDWAIREDDFGMPERLPWMKETSGNMIHQAYHLSRWEETVGTLVGDLDSIVEFGGGYGAMARLVHRLGFRGRYMIYDLPEFSALQDFYLSGIGIPAMLKTTGDDIFPDPLDADLLIACFSLGEVSPRLRDAFLEFPFRSYLIVSQRTWNGCDLFEYFDAFADGRPDLVWKTWIDPILRGERYWIGH